MRWEEVSTPIGETSGGPGRTGIDVSSGLGNALVARGRGENDQPSIAPRFALVAVLADSVAPSRSDPATSFPPIAPVSLATHCARSVECGDLQLFALPGRPKHLSPESDAGRSLPAAGDGRIGSPLLGHSLTRQVLTGIVIAFAGAVYMIVQGDLDVLRSLQIYPGDAIMLLAMLFVGALFRTAASMVIALGGWICSRCWCRPACFILLPVFLVDIQHHGG